MQSFGPHFSTFFQWCDYVNMRINLYQKLLYPIFGLNFFNFNEYIVGCCPTYSKDSILDKNINVTSNVIRYQIIFESMSKIFYKIGDTWSDVVTALNNIDYKSMAATVEEKYG